MAEEEPSEDQGWRPTVPTTVIAVAVIVALVAVSALLVVLFRRTTGPGEVLRTFSRRIAAEDCAGSFELLDEAVTGRIEEDEWCEMLPEVGALLRPGFDIERVTLQGGRARIMLETADRRIVWVLVRDDRSWQVLGTRDPSVLPLP